MSKFSVIDGGLSSNESPHSLERKGGGDDNGGMDDIVHRVGLLELDVRSIKEALARLEPRIIEMHAFATATVPTLATKADVADVRALLAEKPGKGYLWAVLGVLVASVMAAAAFGVAIAPVLSKAAP